MISRDLVREALALIKRTSEYRYFFSQLSAPDWLPPLVAEGVFKEPPSPIDAGEYVTYAQWPASEYLARVAGDAPEAAVAALLDIPVSANPFISRDIARTVAALPPDQAASLADMLIEWIRTAGVHWEGKVFGDVVAYLLEHGHAAAAGSVFSALFGVVPGTTGSDFLDLRQVQSASRMDRWEYRETLEHLCTAVSTTAVTLLEWVLGLLAETLKAEGRNDSRSGGSRYWRPDLLLSELDEREDLKEAQVGAATRLAERIARTRPHLTDGVLAKLEQSGLSVANRIRLHILACLPWEQVDAAAREALLDERNTEDDDLQKEYAELLAAHYARLNADDQTAVRAQLLNDPPDIDDWRRWREREVDRAVTEAELDRYRWQWRLSKLAPIQDFLPVDVRRTYDRWSAELPAVRDPRTVEAPIATWVGPESPFPAEHLAELDASRVIALVTDWAPSADVQFGPSREGLARAFSADVAARPAEYLSAPDALTTLPGLYFRHAVGGLEKALRSAVGGDHESAVAVRAADWGVAGRVLRAGHRHAVCSSPRDLGAEQGIAHLLRVLVSQEVVSVSLDAAPDLLEVLKGLLESPDPTLDQEARDEANGLSPIDRALNSVRGAALGAAIYVGLWLTRTGSAASPVVGDQVSELRGLLERHLDAAAEPSIAVRAVYGQLFPLLTLVDSEWSERLVGVIFATRCDGDARGAAAWQSYLEFNRAYASLLPILRGQYMAAVECECGGNASEHDDGETAGASLMRHLLSFYWRGDLEAETYPFVARLFECGSDQLRASGIGFLGRQLCQEGVEPDEGTQQRLLALWQQRIEALDDLIAPASPEVQQEAREFGWWFASGKLDYSESIRLLRSSVRIGTGIEDLRSVLDRLQAMSEHHLGATLEVVEELSLARVDWRWQSASEALGAILTRASASGDGSLASRARFIRDRFAARGLEIAEDPAAR